MISAFIRNLHGRKILTENEVKDLLRVYKITTTRYALINSAHDININNLKKLDYPVVLKVCSPRYSHKTEVGGVKLNIKTKQELFDAVKEFQCKFPGERLLVETQELKGIEVIIGLVQDPTFDIAIMFGLGGVFTEALRDVTFRIVPIERYDAEQMLQEIKARKIFEGFRGMKVSRNALIDILLKTSQLGYDCQHYIKELDLNPVFARAKDAVVVDARMILR